MKPNENQIESINLIISIIESWKNTNDINSPTHESDINEELRKLDFLKLNHHNNIKDILSYLWTIVTDIK